MLRQERRMQTRRFFLVLGALLLVLAGQARAITIRFDYTYDTNSFFSGANVDRRNYLEAAAQVFTSTITDSLLAITPGGSNTFTAKFSNPSTGSQVSLSNYNVST